MNHWAIKASHLDAPPGFPFAILNWKKEVIAWVKTRNDAESIKKADGSISGLESDLTRNKRLYAGQFISRRK